MTSDAVMDKVTDAVKAKGWTFEILSTNLSQEQEEQLRKDFGVE
jgi:uncharacterized membrane protein